MKIIELGAEDNNEDAAMEKFVTEQVSPQNRLATSTHHICLENVDYVSLFDHIVTILHTLMPQ